MWWHEYGIKPPIFIHERKIIILVEFGNNKADQKAFLEQQEQLQVQKEVTETVEETPEVKVTNFW